MADSGRIIMKNPINRRDMLKTAAKTTVGAVVGASMAIPANAATIKNPDAKLIALFAELVKVRERMVAMFEHEPTFDKVQYSSYSDDELEAAYDAEYDKYAALEEQILLIAAQTAEGVNIKLNIWMEHQDPSFPKHVDWVDQLVASALEDLKRFAPIDTPAA